MEDAQQQVDIIGDIYKTINKLERLGKLIMTNKELQRMSNSKLADLLKTSICNIENGLRQLIIDDDIRDIVDDNINLYKEIYKRLIVKPRNTFNDEQFNV